jgi:hypothetical protein
MIPPVPPVLAFTGNNNNQMKTLQNSKKTSTKPIPSKHDDFTSSIDGYGGDNSEDDDYDQDPSEDYGGNAKKAKKLKKFDPNDADELLKFERR